MSRQLRLNFMFTCFGKLFISGTTAKGVLKIYTLNETKINRLKVGIVGKICIEADDVNNPTTIKKTFYSSQEHIFTAAELVANDDYDEQLVEYAIPLASNLPPTIVLQEGSIMYELYATMEEQFPDGSTQNVNTQAAISVVTLVDCNTIPKASKEKIAKTAHVNSCFCFKTNEVSNSLLVNPRVHVPGDCMKINAVIYNTDPTPIFFVQAALIQKVKLKFEDQSAKAERVVSKALRGCIMPENVQVWRDELLRIPPLPCTTYHKYLHISYKLKLTPMKQADDNGTAKPLLKIPIIIGNIPLESSLSSFNPLQGCESFGNSVLPIPKPFQEYAKSENCIQVPPTEGSKFVPSYITYSTDYAMENVELQ